MEEPKPHRHAKVRRQPAHADAASAAAAAEAAVPATDATVAAAEDVIDTSEHPPMSIDMTAVLPPIPTKPLTNIVEWVRQTPEQTAKFVAWCDSDVTDEEQTATIEYATRWDLARLRNDANYMPNVSYDVEKKEKSSDRVFKTVSVDPATGKRRPTTWSNLITPVYRMHTLALLYHGNYSKDGPTEDMKYLTKSQCDATRGVTLSHRPSDTLLPASLLESQKRAFDELIALQLDKLVPLNHPDPTDCADTIARIISCAMNTNPPAVRVDPETGAMGLRLKSMVASVRSCKSDAKATHKDKLATTGKAFDRAVGEWAVLEEDPVFFNKSDDVDLPEPIYEIAHHVLSSIATSRKTMLSGKTNPVDKVNGFEHIPVCIMQDGVPVILSQLSLAALQRNYRKFLAWAMIKPPHFVSRVPDNVPIYMARIVLLSTRIQPGSADPADQVKEEYVAM